MSPPDLNNDPYDLNDRIADPPRWLEQALRVPREEGYVEADGCRIHYFRWGDRSKPGLLLLHGFLAHARCFAFIAPFLAEKYHVIAYDLSGMGDSGARDIYPQETRVAELVAVAEETGLFEHDVPPVIIAHSYGGNVGISAMEAAEERFGGLIICDLMAMRPARLEAFHRNSRKPGSQDPDRPNRVYPDYETAKGRFVLSPPQETGVPALFDYMAYHSLKQTEEGWTWKFDPSVFYRDADQEEKWKKTGQRIVNAPGRKAVVYGQQSFLFDDDSAAWLRELGGEHIPMIAIPHARHHLMLDQPIAFVSVLKTILAQWGTET